MLTKDQQKFLLSLARNTITEHFRSMDPIPFDLAWAQVNRACFVTLKTRTGRLRGCIGSLEASASLSENVRYFAKAAAFHDPRFPALNESELSTITIGITIIGDLEKVSDFRSVVVGMHGLLVRNGTRQGVLLASVAVENGWEVEEFIRQTCYKAQLEQAKRDRYEWFVFEEESFLENQVSPR